MTWFPTIFTPQGDGNAGGIDICWICACRDSRQYLPRKGTETSLTTIVKNNELEYVFPTIFTPQGDGNNNVYSPFVVSMTLLIPDNIYPARGRKLIQSYRFFPTIATIFPTIFTPQGDGNAIRMVLKIIFIENSRQYLPRKGTETTLICLNIGNSTMNSFPTIFTPQGDGNT